MLRAALATLLCLGAGGCALLPGLAMNAAMQGAAVGAVALGLGPMAALQEKSNPDRCAVHTGKGLAVTESLETIMPFDEGLVRQFAPADWRVEIASEGNAAAGRARAPTEIMLAVGEKSVLFVPPPGATRTRIPYQLVLSVETDAQAGAGEPGALIVKSCYGRVDIVTFRQSRFTATDPAMTADAAAQLQARLAAFRVAIGE
jgi:hypothetical protein